MKSPAYWESKATEAQDREDWQSASDYWMKAKGASIGHKRRDRYERWSDRCLEKLNHIGS